MLATYDQVLAQMDAAERSDGWLVACEQVGRFVAVNEQFVSALARRLESLGDGPVLEVCAGDGELAGRLRDHGVEVIATDADPPGGSEVERAGAGAGMCRYQPRVVLGSFVPFDSGVDAQVLAEPCVLHYVRLDARLGGQFGAPSLWDGSAWRATQLDEATRWMICRHDVWMGPGQPILQHGEAWLLERKAGS